MTSSGGRPATPGSPPAPAAARPPPGRARARPRVRGCSRPARRRRTDGRPDRPACRRSRRRTHRPPARPGRAPRCRPCGRPTTPRRCPARGRDTSLGCRDPWRVSVPASQSRVPELEPGDEFAGCRIEAVAGRGGMGVVYRATELSLGRPVALKLLAPERARDGSFRERFQRESRMAAAIDHPNVIPVYAAGESDGLLYLVMRYVGGTDLHALLRERGAPRARAGGRHRRPGGCGARRRARRRARAPRRQAGQRAAGRRPRLPERLRAHAARGLRHAAHRVRPVGRDRRVLRARAPARRADRRARGRLLARLRAVRGADRRAAVHDRHRAGDHARPPPRRAADAVRARGAAGVRPRDRPRAGQGPRRPLSVGGRPRARRTGRRPRRADHRVRAQRRGRLRRAERGADAGQRRRGHRGHAPARGRDRRRRRRRPAAAVVDPAGRRRGAAAGQGPHGRPAAPLAVPARRRADDLRSRSSPSG